jgi:hypothetical protein
MNFLISGKAETKIPKKYISSKFNILILKSIKSLKCYRQQRNGTLTEEVGIIWTQFSAKLVFMYPFFFSHLVQSVLLLDKNIVKDTERLELPTFMVNWL